VFFDRECERLIERINKGEIRGGTQITLASLEAIKTTVLGTEAEKVRQLLKNLRSCSSAILAAQPTNVALSNAVQFVQRQVGAAADRGIGLDKLRDTVARELDRYSESLRRSVDEIGKIGATLIEDKDVIMTHDASTSVISILGTAQAEGKEIKAIVLETRPEFHGRLSAMAIADIGVPVTLIIDAACRHCVKIATKVLLGGAAIFPSGDALGKMGSSVVALAAREAGVPVYVAASTHKFCPEPAFANDMSRVGGVPSLVFSSEHATNLGIDVANPFFETIPCKDITSIVTERGILSPSKVASAIKDIYAGGV